MNQFTNKAFFKIGHKNDTEIEYNSIYQILNIERRFV